MGAAKSVRWNGFWLTLLAAGACREQPQAAPSSGAASSVQVADARGLASARPLGVRLAASDRIQSDAGRTSSLRGLTSEPQLLYSLDREFRPVIDRGLLLALTEAERAAAAYVASVVGTACDQDGSAGLAPARVTCALTTALGLGLQCEGAHRESVQKWFGKAMPALCYQKPATAYSQTSLDRLLMSRAGPRIILSLDVVGTEGPGGPSYRWSERLAFEERESHLVVIEQKTTGNPHPDRKLNAPK